VRYLFFEDWLAIAKVSDEELGKTIKKGSDASDLPACMLSAYS